jgi:hypothetical protein
MSRLCFLGCLEVTTKAVTSLTIESAIRTFNPSLLIFADSPWFPRADNSSRPPDGPFLPFGLAPRVLELGSEEAWIRLKSLGYLEAEADARKRLEKLGKAGLLSERDAILLEGIDESRKVFGVIFEAGLKAQNDRILCRRALDAEMTGRNILATILEALPGGVVPASRLRAIAEAAKARREALFQGLAEIVGEEKDETLVVCGLPDKAAFLESIEAGHVAAKKIPKAMEFWE